MNKHSRFLSPRWDNARAYLLGSWRLRMGRALVVFSGNSIASLLCLTLPHPPGITFHIKHLPQFLFLGLLWGEPQVQQKADSRAGENQGDMNSTGDLKSEVLCKLLHPETSISFSKPSSQRKLYISFKNVVNFFFSILELLVGIELGFWCCKSKRTFLLLSSRQHKGNEEGGEVWSMAGLSSFQGGKKLDVQKQGQAFLQEKWVKSVPGSNPVPSYTDIPLPSPGYFLLSSPRCRI